MTSRALRHTSVIMLLVLLMLFSSRPAEAGDKKKDERLGGDQLRAWAEQKEKQGFDKRTVAYAIRYSRGHKGMMEFFLRKAKEKKWHPKQIAASYQLARPKSSRDLFSDEHLDHIERFWKHLSNPYAPTSFDEVVAVYKSFPTRLDLHQLYFWYKYKSHDKKPKPPVTPGELIAVFKYAKGVENNIAYYFKMRLDEKKPIDECKELLVYKLKGIDPEEAKKEKAEKAKKDKDKDKDEKKADGDKGDEAKADEKGEKEVKEKDGDKEDGKKGDDAGKKKGKKKDRPEDDVLQFD